MSLIIDSYGAYNHLLTFRISVYKISPIRIISLRILLETFQIESSSRDFKPQERLYQDISNILFLGKKLTLLSFQKTKL